MTDSDHTPRCDSVVNNGMGEPTECGRTLPCEYHTPQEPRTAHDCLMPSACGATGFYCVNSDTLQEPRTPVITCTMDDGGQECGRRYERNGCSVHARSSEHRGHRILVNGHDNRWCHDCSEWVDFDPSRAAA